METIEKLVELQIKLYSLRNQNLVLNEKKNSTGCPPFKNPPKKKYKKWYKF